MVLQIAHQVVRTARSCAQREASADPHPFQKTKNADGPVPHPISFTFPKAHAGWCLVDHRAMPSLTTTPSPDGESRGNGTRKLC
jgi:hypothetical protein